MAMVTHQMQGSYATFPSRPLSWSKGVKLKQRVTELQMVGRTDMCFSVKCSLRLSAGAFSHGPKVKLLRVSAFKGSAQNDESGGRANGSKVSKNSVKLSYVPKESEETMMDSSKVHSIPFSYTSEANDRIAGSPAINKLFKKWLSMLRTQPPSQVVDEILEEGPPPREELQQAQNTTQNKERVGILKSVGYHFLSLDATIKIPILTFIPLFLAVNVMYGSVVSKELTPLWILGPLIVAFYIKLLQGLWSLYVFSFRQTVKVIKNVPAYYLVVSGYIRQGLKEDIQARVLQPLQSFKNLDCKEFSRKKMMELQEWLMEKYLDYVESIWPYYCRAIRFLKRANLI
ncbi:DEFECTIVE 2759 putative ISOFORM 1-RELATED [Salix viminalis]|uniref:DEFECTIVE 2759 putative ISOFORM 1-RELATED n=1 Tax=Salix viminalis TaxID=40686 RepID=A0A9Q0NVN3_SALVM|nr:DEFECTIVE 2759 putative ISOFORM 1-RELATED [Salix viminalis]KAJ6676650.1 DEFECTIVE 2759 putative ISOFORM 1-RELATED [Salix viminalis]